MIARRVLALGAAYLPQPGLGVWRVGPTVQSIFWDYAAVCVQKSTTLWFLFCERIYSQTPRRRLFCWWVGGPIRQIGRRCRPTRLGALLLNQLQTQSAARGRPQQAGHPARRGALVSLRARALRESASGFFQKGS